MEASESKSAGGKRMAGRPRFERSAALGALAIGPRRQAVLRPGRFEAMQQSNILRLDDFMLRGARVGAGVVGVGILVTLAWPEGAEISRGLVAAGVALSALVPISMLVLGLALRGREQQAAALLRLMERHVEVSADDLLANSDFTPSSLETAIRDLHSAGLRHIVWDRRSNLLQDGWLRRSRVHIESCASCGTKIAMDVPLHEAASARCPSCDAPLDAREVDDEKQAMMAEISERARPRPAAPRTAWPFSIPLFLLLLVACWPLALVYAVKCWQPTRCAAAEIPSCGTIGGGSMPPAA